MSSIRPRAARVYCVLICAFLQLITLSGAAQAASPRALGGTLDLTRIDWARAEPIRLAGEWEFYWMQLLEPDDLRREDAPAPTGYVSVPGAWNGFSAPGVGPIGADGYATYRLTILLPDEAVGSSEASARLALHLEWSFTAYTLWIDGQRVASNGTVATSAGAMTPEFRPTTIPFNAADRAVELVIQVSNFMHRNGGLWNAPLLGTYEQIAQRQTIRQAFDMFLIGAILFMGIYHLVLFALFKRRPAPIYLGYTCLVVAVRTMVTSEHMLDRFLDGLPWGVELRIEYVTGYAFLIGYIGFLRAIYPDETPRPVRAAAWIVGALGILVTLATPVRFSSLFIPYYIRILALFALFSLAVFVLAAIRRREGAPILVWGAFAFVFSLFHDFYHYNLLGFDIDLVPFGLFILLLFQSFALAERFSISFNRELALARENAQLLQTVRAQLDEVRESRRLLAAADENLRQAIAERLHGRVQIRLLAVWKRLGDVKEWIDPDQSGAVRAEIEAVQKEIDDVREVEIRRVSHLLHPSSVQVGLLPAIDSLAGQFEKSFAVRIEADDAVKELDNPAHNRIPHRVRLVAYRVLEDALANVQAHAGASSVRITLRITPEHRLEMEIADDGRGFDVERVQPKLGLHTIAARVDTIGGSWSLTSKVGGGTTLRAQFPLDGAESKTKVGTGSSTHIRPVGVHA